MRPIFSTQPEHMKEKQHPLPIVVEDLIDFEASDLASRLMHLPWIQLQNLAFKVLLAMYNKESPIDDPVGKQLGIAFMSPPDFNPTPTVCEMELQYVDFDKNQDHGAGVLFAVSRFACMMVRSPNRFRFLSSREPEWPLLIGPHKDRLKFTAELMNELGLVSLPLRANTSKVGLGLKHDVLTRHISDIQNYIKDPVGFLIPGRYTFDPGAFQEGPDDDENPDPVPIAYWLKWPKLADNLSPLSAETKVPWWEAIWEKIMEETQGRPEIAPTHRHWVDRFEDLSPIGVPAVRDYRINRYEKSSEYKALLRREDGSDPKGAAYSMMNKLRKNEYLPDDLTKPANMKVARNMIMRELRERFFTIANKYNTNRQP